MSSCAEKPLIDNGDKCREYKKTTLPIKIGWFLITEILNFR